MNELFNGINEADKIRILQYFESLTLFYKKDEIILSSVKNDDIICIIITGHIQIIKNDFNGNQTIIEELKEGDVFGSISANISSNEYDIITKEDSKIIILEFNNIINYNYQGECYTKFTKNLLSILYKKIQEFNNRIEILTNKTIRNKLLAYFKMMSINNNIKTVYLPFSFSNLADYLAINRSAMTRELRQLKDEGLIEIKGRKIKLLYYI